MKIGVIGGGITGLTVAYDLAGAGQEVILWEAQERLGGLASGFRDERWEWPLDRFYHHLFASDRAALALSREVGAEVFFRRPETVIWHRATMEPFDSPLAVLRFSHLRLPEKLRTGLVVLYLRLLRDWRPLEGVRAEEWLRRTMGERAYHVLWQPLFEGKFGEGYRDVNMAWFWARISKRSKALGYYVGGFQALADRLGQAVAARGGRVEAGRAVTQVQPLAGGGYEVHVDGQTVQVDRAVVTVGPQAALAILRGLPAAYAEQLRRLRSLGAMTLVLALDRPLTRGLYWVNLPKRVFPFLALVEHTNYIERGHYGGDHLVYLGDYLPESHPHFQMSQEELLKAYLPAVQCINPGFAPSWVRKSWLFREREAQPFTPLNHSRAIPALRTPLPGLYLASMSQVYPWDRGTNYAVEIGREVARTLLGDG
ncbi:MAG: NAD(P)/FAD-dependent oxidoreductase [Anaerolineae bacterium]|nr:NAD(P)/FAD-dependent oxidoreductase [Anaerolineae bacterium]